MEPTFKMVVHDGHYWRVLNINTGELIPTPYNSELAARDSIGWGTLARRTVHVSRSDVLDLLNTAYNS